ncbi:flippase-like domain-containing protein [Luteimonas sp. SJ-92]|uniref:Flippase-like domain-containing protein n=1 Tax=Luteimonas salinisoli TaxID=2752307 RepID=A0A853J827_9GAMM|nr:lysylphosphatidylglycerol synthase transmembrane domain-containing protein [Luteimonas salinisoli]NZA25316.1 flippase-like domain-containing protein [Luteimonas salinisoli]
MSTHSTRKRRSFRALQLAVAVAAFFYVFSLVDLQEARRALSGIDLRFFAAAFFLALLGLFSASLRWVILLRSAGIGYRILDAFRCYLAGAFYGLAMPGVIGGDVSRVVICRHQTGAPLGKLTGSVLLERYLGVVTLLCLLVIGLSSSSAEFLPPQAATVAPLLAAAGLAAILAVPALVRRNTLGVALHPRLARLGGLLDAVGGLRPAGLAKALGLSGGFQLSDILGTYLVGQALGTALHGPELLVALPLAYLATALPISPSGLGIREATLVLVLAQAGVSTSEAALLALVIFFIRVLVGILGGLDQMLGTLRK